MKIFVYILSFVVISLSAKPLLHQYVHAHEISHSDNIIGCYSDTDCDCCDEHDGNSENEAKHCGDESKHCGDEGHDCNGNCHCVFSISSTFRVEASQKIQIREIIIKKTYSFTSEYTFDYPSFIWHPPQLG